MFLVLRFLCPPFSHPSSRAKVEAVLRGREADGRPVGFVVGPKRGLDDDDAVGALNDPAVPEMKML
jgi:hypothetical protein